MIGNHVNVVRPVQPIDEFPPAASLPKTPARKFFLTYLMRLLLDRICQLSLR